MSNGWTPERKARQAEFIRIWRPWERSTGPTSAAGMALVARNAWKGGRRAELTELRKCLRQQRQQLLDDLLPETLGLGTPKGCG